MNNRTLFISSLVLVAAIVAAVLYLGAGSPDEASAALAAKATAQDKGAREATSKEVNRELYVDSSTGRSKIEKVDPAKYSSIPPKQKWEWDIINLADRRDMSDMDKATQLLSRINSLPPEGRVMAMEHAAALIPDDQYLQMRPWIFQIGNSNNEEMREAIMTDSLTRGDSIRMPTFVEMLRQPNNPTYQEAHDILVAYLDVDHGKDLGKWDQAVKQWLIENPE